MKPDAALVELLARMGASRGMPVYFGSQELREWPPNTVAVMKEQKLLARSRPASSVVCPGCEQECVMPVHVIPTDSVAARAFVICDKRSDINRVELFISDLEQWQVSGDSVADCVARLLGVTRPGGSAADGGRWEVGTFKGTKQSGHLVLIADGELKLMLSGHSIALADALNLTDGGIAIDKRILRRCVDNPRDGGGDTESASQRRERLVARVREERKKGSRAFLKVVAAEEGISASRLKQILKTEPYGAGKAAIVDQRSKRATPKLEKAKR